MALPLFPTRRERERERERERVNKVCPEVKLCVTRSIGLKFFVAFNFVTFIIFFGFIMTAAAFGLSVIDSRLTFAFLESSPAKRHQSSNNILSSQLTFSPYDSVPTKPTFRESKLVKIEKVHE